MALCAIIIGLIKKQISDRITNLLPKNAVSPYSAVEYLSLKKIFHYLYKLFLTSNGLITWYTYPPIAIIAIAKRPKSKFIAIIPYLIKLEQHGISRMSSSEQHTIFVNFFSYLSMNLFEFLYFYYPLENNGYKTDRNSVIVPRVCLSQLVIQIEHHFSNALN